MKFLAEDIITSLIYWTHLSVYISLNFYIVISYQYNISSAGSEPVEAETPSTPPKKLVLLGETVLTSPPTVQNVGHCEYF